MSIFENMFNSLLSEGLKRPIYSEQEAKLSDSKNSSQVSTNNDIETSYITYDPFSSYTNSILQDRTASNTQNDFIRQWRRLAGHVEVAGAVAQICNEAIVFDSEEPIIQIDLDSIEIPKKTKKTITESFEKILFLLNFNEAGDELFRQWYIDSVLSIESVYNKNKISDGIQKLILLSPFNFFKIKEERSGLIKYFYNTKPSYNIIKDLENSDITYFEDQITQINSGDFDTEKKVSVSYLNSANKLCNQLMALEDSLIIFRITRSPEKRVFYIDTGNLQKNKAEEYIKNLMAKYRQKRIYNTESGTVENKSKQISILEDFWLPVQCLDLNTKIKLLDSRDLSLNDIIIEFNKNIPLWVYSVKEDGEVIPGKISWAGITRKNTEVLKVILDNDEEIICTPDHKFIMRDGTKIEAKDLKPLDSLMPGYFKEKNIYESKQQCTYTQILNNKTNKFNFVHRLVDNYMNNEKKNNEVVHHINMDRYNNNPENLKRMDKIKHWNYHSKCGTNSWKNSDFKQHCDKLSISGKKWHSLEENKLKFKISMEKRSKNNNELKQKNPVLYNSWFQNKKYIIHSEPIYTTKTILLLKTIIDENYSNNISMNSFRKLILENTDFQLSLNPNNDKNYKFSKSRVNFNEIVKNIGYNSLIEYIASNYPDYKFIRNHKVKSIEILNYTLDTGCITVDNSENTHNFLLSSGIFVMNSANGTSRGTKIENLQGQNPGFGDMSDINYFVNKLNKALHIPVASQEGEGRVVITGAIDIEKDELRFFKFVLKLRRKFNNLFVDLLKKDLLSRQVLTIQDWNKIQEKIKFKYSNSNEFSTIKKLQMLMLKIDSANNAAGLLETKILDPLFVQQNILDLSDEEIKRIETHYLENPPEVAGGGSFKPHGGFSKKGGQPIQPEPDVVPEQPAGPAKEENLILSSDIEFAAILDKLQDGDILVNDKNEQIKYENGTFHKI